MRNDTTMYSNANQRHNVQQPYTFLDGTLCIIRAVNGENEILAIEPQWHWKEYTGVFSLLNTVKNTEFIKG